MSDDNRVMSNGARGRETHAQRTAELVGDGTSLDADTFASFGLAERTHLFKTNPDRYRELQAEVDRRTDLGNLARNGGGR